MIKNTILILLLFFAFEGFTQETFSLDEAVNYAYENQNSVKLKQLDVRDATGQINEYKSIGLPKLSASLGYQYYLAAPASPVEDFITPSIYGVLFSENVIPQKDLGPPEVQTISFVPKNNLSAGLDANWQIFDGSYLTGLTQARLYEDLVAQEIDVTKEEIKAQVTKAYIAILIADKNLDILNKNLENVSSALSDLEVMYANGFIEQLDVDRLSLSKENLQIEKEKVAQLITLSYNLLKFQMGYPLEQSISLSEELESLIEEIEIESIDLYESVDFNEKAAYNNILLGIELQELNKKRIEKTKLPTINAFASVSESLQRNNLFNGNEGGLIPTAVAGVNVKVPILDGKLRKAQLSRSEITIEKANLQKTEYERVLNLQASNARITLINAKRQLGNQERALALNQKIYEVSAVKYKEGVGSSLELSQAEANLYLAQGNYINALYQFILSKTELDIVLGKL